MSDASQLARAEQIKKYTPQPPKQVRDAALNVDALINAQRTPPPAPGEEPPAQPPAPPPGAPTPPPQQPTPVPSAAQPPAQQPGGEPPAPAGQDGPEHQLRSLQGRYDNQVRLNNELTERLGNMERMVASMRVSGVQQPGAEPPPPPAPVRLLTAEEQAEYGDEFVEVVGKRAREVVAPELSALELRFKNLENRLEGVTTVTAQSAREQLYATLDGQVDGWRQINQMPEFKDWLQFAEPLSGRRRNDLLQEAFAGHEANRVVKIFQGFISAATGTPPAPQPPAPTPGQPGTTEQLTLEDLAAPGRARSSPQQPLPPEKPTYTSAWYAAFMRDKLDGKWKGREAEADAIERDVFAAQHEGRFIP